MAVDAVVREWRDEEGWGVVDSPQTPGGCWVHFSAIATAGYRTAHAGQDVQLEWEPADQDGFAYRAVRLWPSGDVPAEPVVEEGGGAYQSSLTLTFDEPPPTADH